MINRLIMVVALCLASSSHAIAPDTSLRLSEFIQTQLDLDDGLPQNTVMALAQDQRGFVWVGTLRHYSRSCSGLS